MTDLHPSLLDSIQRSSEYEGKGHRYLTGGGREHYRRYAELFACAGGIQRDLAALGLRRGDRLALIAGDAASFSSTFLAGALAGFVLVPLSPPPPTQRDGSYLDKLRGMLQTCGAQTLLAPQALTPRLAELDAAVNVVSYETMLANVALLTPTVVATLDDVCFLQFTSGSTGDPRAVAVTHRNIAANSRAIMVDGIGIEDRDVGVSWLPLFHDMGLIGKLIAPLVYPTEMVYLSTYAFIKNPNLWLDTITRYRGTISFGPNFAFALAVRHYQNRPRAFDLRSLRVLGCGAEPISPEVLETFCRTFSPHGLSPSAVMPSYGMAEATLAVSFDSRSRPFRTLSIDRSAYENERMVRIAQDSSSLHTLRIVGCGRSFPGHDIAIVDANGHQLPERQIGEIRVRGPSIAKGYYNNPLSSAQSFINDWLRTGDLGFLDDGELFVSGRMKDLIIINGRNYFPQDLEWVAERVAGVRRGSVAAFSVPGRSTEEIVVVAEFKRYAGDGDAEDQIRHQIREDVGLTADIVVLARPGSVPKSTSGKVQRRRTRALYLAGFFEPATTDTSVALVD